MRGTSTMRNQYTVLFWEIAVFAAVAWSLATLE